MKFIINLIIFSLGVSVTTWAGTGTHGGDHVKDRILWAKVIAQGWLKSPGCLSIFTGKDCTKMAQKLAQSDVLWNSDKSHPLKAVVDGRIQEVTATTTEALSDPITVDTNRALNIMLDEAILLMVHEGSRAIDQSDRLIPDKKIIAAFSERSGLAALYLDATKCNPNGNNCGPAPGPLPGTTQIEVFKATLDSFMTTSGISWGDLKGFWKKTYDTLVPRGNLGTHIAIERPDGYSYKNSLNNPTLREGVVFLEREVGNSFAGSKVDQAVVLNPWGPDYMTTSDLAVSFTNAGSAIYSYATTDWKGPGVWSEECRAMPNGSTLCALRLCSSPHTADQLYIGQIVGFIGRVKYAPQF